MYKYMPIKYHLFNENDNMIYGDSVIQVSIDDEGAGTFIVIRQNHQEIRLDSDEIPVLFEVINKMLKECDKIEKSDNERFGRGV